MVPSHYYHLLGGRSPKTFFLIFIAHAKKGERFCWCIKEIWIIHNDQGCNNKYQDGSNCTGCKMVSTPVRCTWPYKGTIRFLSTPPLGQPQEQSLPENLFKRSRQIVSPPDANFKGSPTKKADGIYPLQGVGRRGESGQNGMPSATWQKFQSSFQ